jgi:hypothetical protein
MLALQHLSEVSMDFGKALHALKDGKNVSRDGWNGKDQYVYYVPETRYEARGRPRAQCHPRGVVSATWVSRFP